MAEPHDYTTTRPENLKDAFARLSEMAKSAPLSFVKSLDDQVAKIRAVAKARGIELEEQK